MTGSKLLLIFVSILFTSFAQGNGNTGGDHSQTHHQERNDTVQSESVEFYFFSWGSCEKLEEMLERELIDLGCKTQTPHPHSIEPAKCFCPSVRDDSEDQAALILSISKPVVSRNSCPGKYPCDRGGACINGRWQCTVSR